MKKITTLFFILLAVPFYPQWVQQTSGISVTTGLFDIHCITEDFVLAVGQNGTILKTTDGGNNWILKNSGTTLDLSQVAFGSPNVGYIAGESGLVIKTTDGGESWAPTAVGISTSITSLFCLDENTFFIGDGSGNIKKTTNGGFSFETLVLNGAGYIRDIQFLNETIGYASDEFDLYKTTDGGATWSIIHNSVFSFFFITENIGFINAGDGLTKTIDGGINDNLLETILFRMDKIFATSENIIWGVPKNFFFNDPPHRIMRGEIINSNQFQMTLNDNPLFVSINFANPTKGYAVANGNIYKNSTGNLLAISELNKKENVKIFPNPSSNQITISFDQESFNPFAVEITDSLGKKIFEESYANQNNVHISTATFSKGIYLITINCLDKKQRQKLIVK